MARQPGWLWSAPVLALMLVLLPATHARARQNAEQMIKTIVEETNQFRES